MLSQTLSNTDEACPKNQQLGQQWQQQQTQLQLPQPSPQPHRQQTIKELEGVQLNQLWDQNHPEPLEIKPKPQIHSKLQLIDEQKLITDQLTQRREKLALVEPAPCSSLNDVIGGWLKSLPFDPLPFLVSTASNPTKSDGVGIASSVNENHTASAQMIFTNTSSRNFPEVPSVSKLGAFNVDPAVSSGFISFDSGSMNYLKSLNPSRPSVMNHNPSHTDLISCTHTQLSSLNYGISEGSSPTLPVSQNLSMFAAQNYAVSHPITYRSNGSYQTHQNLNFDTGCNRPVYSGRSADMATLQHNNDTVPHSQKLLSVPSKSSPIYYPLQQLLPKSLANTPLPHMSRLASGEHEPAPTSLPQRFASISKLHPSMYDTKNYPSCTHRHDENCYSQLPLATMSLARATSSDMTAFSTDMKMRCNPNQPDHRLSGSGYAPECLHGSMYGCGVRPESSLDSIPGSNSDISPIPSPESDDYRSAFTFVMTSDQSKREQDILNTILSEMYAQRLRNEVSVLNQKYESVQYDRLPSMTRSSGNFCRDTSRYQDPMTRAMWVRDMSTDVRCLRP